MPIPKNVKERIRDLAKIAAEKKTGRVSDWNRMKATYEKSKAEKRKPKV